MDRTYFFMLFASVAGTGLGILQYIWTTSGKILQGVQKSLTTPTYVYFQDHATPFLVSEVQLEGAGIPPIRWFYCPETRTFWRPNDEDLPTHRFPWLGGEIKTGENTLYPISDFLDGLRWRGEGQRPSLEDICAAWSIESRVILGGHQHLVLEVINEEGEVETLPLRQRARGN